jgi:cyclopropane fatty-acyl-phospholipid synthase-like methyltransferase
MPRHLLASGAPSKGIGEKPVMSKPFSQACENNKASILAKIAKVFKKGSLVLEIGSCTAQHVRYFAEHLPLIHWQPTDTAESMVTLQAGLEGVALPNIQPPRILDVSKPDWPVDAVDGVFSANTLHIMPFEAVADFFRGVGKRLKPGGSLCVYGPFKYKGEFTTPSNADFDSWLRNRDPRSGVRDFEQVAILASDNGMRLMADHAMPANNQLLVFSRIGVQH